MYNAPLYASHLKLTWLLILSCSTRRANPTATAAPFTATATFATCAPTPRFRGFTYFASRLLESNTRSRSARSCLHLYFDMRRRAALFCRRRDSRPEGLLPREVDFKPWFLRRAACLRHAPFLLQFRLLAFGSAQLQKALARDATLVPQLAPPARWSRARAHLLRLLAVLACAWRDIQRTRYTRQWIFGEDEYVFEVDTLVVGVRERGRA